ncbi:hypothetical protein SAMN04488587_1950 [Methanococcoides vulcani]|uniref:Uncharacterized protein n=1 Tax=Methanococcoides vulcani TaxID=1353158 RepID=A0A1I0B3X6_9EURY|nr:hypothetical protein SAMN04488587_1950 [Methanococcoides vulcani]
MDFGLYILAFISLIIFALSFKAIRKASGLVLIVLGIMFSLTGLGMIFGIPMIFVGALFLFL